MASSGRATNGSGTLPVIILVFSLVVLVVGVVLSWANIVIVDGTFNDPEPGGLGTWITLQYSVRIGALIAAAGVVGVTAAVVTYVVRGGFAKLTVPVAERGESASDAELHVS